MLPHTPIGQTGEAPGSIFLSAAEANGWMPSNLLKALVGDNASFSHDFGAILRSPPRAYQVGEKMGISRSVLTGVLYHNIGPTEGENYMWQGLEVRSAALRWGDPQLCPACIATDQVPYARGIWDHRLIRSCAVHHCALISVCPGCGDALTWHRPGICECRCGFDFRQISPLKASAAEHAVVEAAIDHGDSTLLNRAFNLHLTLEELAAGGGLAVPREQIPDALSRLVFKPKVLPEILVASVSGSGLAPRLAFRRLWTQDDQLYPEALMASLDAAQYRSIPGDWAEILCEPVNASKFATIAGLSSNTASVVGRSLRSRTKAGEMTLGSVNSFLITFDPSPSATPESGLQPRLIRGINTLGILDQIAAGTAQAFGYLHKHGLMSAQVGFVRKPVQIGAGRMPLVELAQRAQVHYESIRFLVTTGFLEAEYPARGRRVLTVSKADGEDFLQRYRFAGPLARSVGSGQTSFAEKLMASGIEPVSGASVDGGLSYLFLAEDVHSLDLREVSGLTGYPTRTGRKDQKLYDQEELGITFSEVAKAFDANVQTVRTLVRKGHLHRHVDNRRARMVTRSSFDDFSAKVRSKDHIPIQEAAARVKENLETFRRRWVNTDIIPERDLVVVRQIRLSDVCKVAEMKKKYTTSDELGMKLGCTREHILNLVRTRRMSLNSEKVGGRRPIWLIPRSTAPTSLPPPRKSGRPRLTSS